MIFRVNFHGESGEANAEVVAQAMSRMHALLATYKPEDVYNLDETCLYFRAQPAKTLAQGKLKGRKIQDDRLTLAIAVNSTGTNKLKLLVIHKSQQPRYFGRWSPSDIVYWHANTTTWMRSNIFETWMQKLNNSKDKIVISC